jgi:hypothetical protein
LHFDDERRDVGHGARHVCKERAGRWLYAAHKIFLSRSKSLKCSVPSQEGKASGKQQPETG